MARKNPCRHTNGCGSIRDIANNRCPSANDSLVSNSNSRCNRRADANDRPFIDSRAPAQTRARADMCEPIHTTVVINRGRSIDDHVIADFRSGLNYCHRRYEDTGTDS